MLGDTNGDFKRKLLGKTEEKVRGYRSVALSHYCGNGYAFCVMISRKLGLVRHTYVVHLLQETGSAQIHLRQCAALAGRFPIYRLPRRHPVSALLDVATAIEQDILGRSDHSRLGFL